MASTSCFMPSSIRIMTGLESGCFLFLVIVERGVALGKMYSVDIQRQ
jgi:hypothetical protein